MKDPRHWYRVAVGVHLGNLMLCTYALQKTGVQSIAILIGLSVWFGSLASYRLTRSRRKA